MPATEHFLQVALVNYPSVLPYFEPFNVLISSCAVTDVFAGDAIDAQFYDVDGDALSIPVTGFTIAPVCGYTINFEATSATDVSAFVTFDAATQSFVVESDDHSIEDTYTITVLASVNGVENTDVSFVLTIGSCWSDDVSLVTGVANLQFEIGIGRPVIEAETGF